MPSPNTGDFEGMGMPSGIRAVRLLWGGYGFRTDHAPTSTWPMYWKCPFSHSNFVILIFITSTPASACWTNRPPSSAEKLSTDEGLSLINRMFDRILVAPEHEARTLFACNAHSPDGTHVLIQSGCTKTVQQLENAGYTVLEHETNEFLKAGGSVFCMKLMYW